MSRARPLSGGYVAGAVLAVLGILFWVLATTLARHEPRSYSASSAPPTYVSVTAGHTYSLDTPGGLAAVDKIVDPTDLSCTITPEGAAPSALAVTAETNSKALHQVAGFVAPVSGPVRIACAEIGPVYVDDAENSTDYSGLLRLLATLLLAVGLPLAVSGARTRRQERHRVQEQHAVPLVHP